MWHRFQFRMHIHKVNPVKGLLVASIQTFGSVCYDWQAISLEKPLDTNVVPFKVEGISSGIKLVLQTGQPLVNYALENYAHSALANKVWGCAGWGGSRNICQSGIE